MSDAPAKLITFALSHYCEVARWALDWHGARYQEVGWPPGVHRFLAKRAGAKASSVPIVLVDNEVIEGSGAIIDWAEGRNDNSARGLVPEISLDDAMEIEKRLVKVTGVHVRRLVYAHMLPGNAHMVKPMLFANTSILHKAVGLAMWPMTMKLIIKGYRTGGNAAEESRVVLKDELDWLAGLLRDRGGMLGGGKFSRLELIAAGLLAPLARPEQMPTYRNAQMPSELTAILEEWRDRPAIQWVHEIYREYRN